jgi:hypothetical protein
VTGIKRAVVMTMSLAGKDEGDGKGGKSDGDCAKRAIARKRAMASLVGKSIRNSAEFRN